MHLHFIRIKDGAEVDCCLSLKGELSTLVECNLADVSSHRDLVRLAERFPQSEAVQLVREARQVEARGASNIVPTGGGTDSKFVPVALSESVGPRCP